MLYEDCFNFLISKLKSVTQLKFYGSFLKDHHILKLSQLKHLTSFHILGDDSNFEGTHLNLLSPLKELSLRPHLISYNNYDKLIEKSTGLLAKLMIDCDSLIPEHLLLILS